MVSADDLVTCDESRIDNNRLIPFSDDPCQVKIDAGFAHPDIIRLTVCFRTFRKEEVSMSEYPDKRSFILGMLTAFSECVAGGCKRLALSPPLVHEDYEMICDEANKLIEKHGLIHYHEENLDQPEDKRFDWILIAGKQETIGSYLELRRQGTSPVKSLKPFYELLSYQPDESIQTGYDAYREYFE